MADFSDDAMAGIGNVNAAPNADQEQPAPVLDETSDEAQAARLKTFRIAPVDTGEAESAIVPIGAGVEPELDQEQQPQPEIMSEEAFLATWRLSWNLPGMMVPEFKPLGIDSEEKGEACDEAGGAVYELLRLHFPRALAIENETFGLIARALPFALMQAGAVRAILAERRRARMEWNKRTVEHEARPQPANQDTPPAAQEADQEQAATGPVDWRLEADQKDQDAA